LLNAGA
jgi:hypothetical protein